MIRHNISQSMKKSMVFINKVYGNIILLSIIKYIEIVHYVIEFFFST